MKKILWIVIAFLLVCSVALYFYTYKQHRDIANEEAELYVTVTALETEYSADETAANAKYLDRTIQLSGIVSSWDKDAHNITIDHKATAQLAGHIKQSVLQGQQITVKGRFIGYDDLLEEFRLDQATIIP